MVYEDVCEVGMLYEGVCEVGMLYEGVCEVGMLYEDVCGAGMLYEDPNTLCVSYRCNFCGAHSLQKDKPECTLRY
jgi:hypothetical protein